LFVVVVGVIMAQMELQYFDAIRRASLVSSLAADCRLIPCYKLIAYASDSKVARKSADADE
jgi:hypothetical protein